MAKPRVNVHIASEVFAKLDAAANRPGTSKAAIVEAALRSFLSPERDDRRDAAIIRRLDRCDRRLEALARDVLVAAETLSQFVRYYLVITPPLPEADKDAARALGKDRYDYFIEQLAQRLAAGGSLLGEVTEHFAPDANDFFTSADLAGEPLQSRRSDGAADGPVPHEPTAKEGAHVRT